MNYPKISIVTPSYNQGQFLEQTIQSVLGQNYPNLEYIIIDGGSTDNSVEIINKYEKFLYYWVSEKDNGQSDAINKGFKIATGDILGWINSDDFYLPGVFFTIIKKMDIQEDQLLFGNCIHFMETNPEWVKGSNLIESERSKHLLSTELIQPSTFWTKGVWEKYGPLNINFHYAFDMDFFNLLKTKPVDFLYEPRHMSAYRFHKDHKSSSGGQNRLREISKIYALYLGKEYQSIFNYFFDKTNRRRLQIVRKLIHKLLPKRRGEMEIIILKKIYPMFRKFDNRDLFILLKRLLNYNYIL